MRKEEGVSSPLSVALGNFDGVHIGHAGLIGCAVEYAGKTGIRSAVWTFADGAGVLPNKPGVKCITGTEEKLALIASLGVDYVILEDFGSVRNLSPEQFVRGILKKQCRAAAAVCGFNFRFGIGGSGDSEALRLLMAPQDCIVVPPVYLDGEPVSSSSIRARIEAGDMETAARLLGRRFSVSGPVVHGKELGRTIGIPTINQNFPDGQIVPKSGIYACLAEIDGKKYPGVTNVGIRPTIVGDSHRINCETHIIGFEGWLYDQLVTVHFYHRLRDEMKFADIEALRQQIGCDIAAAAEYFSHKEVL